MRKGTGITVWALLALLVAAPPVVRGDALLEQQRKTFREVYPDAELGIWSLTSEQEKLLSQYVLWPDLRAAFFRARLGKTDDADVEAFLDHYGMLKPARELRYRYALHLARDQRLADYMSIYRPYYQGLEIPKLDCLALQAEIHEGRDQRVVNLGSELWLVGKSQADECDPVFSHLRDNGTLSTALYRQRYDLAIEAKNFSLARYLAKSIDPQQLREAGLWVRADADLDAYLAGHEQFGDSENHRRRLLYAVERIALKDPVVAAAHWRQIKPAYAFSDEEQQDTARHIALWAARRHEPAAASELAKLVDEAVDTEVLRWRVRTALREHDWDSVIDGVNAMQDERDADEWQYWLGFSLRQGRDRESGTIILETLASTRGYYGFLAADELQTDYVFSHDAIASDPALAAELASRKPLIRARELFLVGLDGRGRSEWDAAISYLGQEELAQAAKLAHSWGWHSRAIATAARIRHFDDLDVRFPLPWNDSFEKYASAAQVRTSWAYGIARSESLFMRDVRSHAGAVGLMQLLPETGRKTAREFNLPYAGIVTLTDPEENIRLGTTYLAKMYRRFGNDQVLATAAYNAGPLNVEAWLPDADSLDARIWIENIPYNETRKYVRRVLETDAIFHWRMTGDVRRVSSALTTISPDSSKRQVANAN